MSKECTKCASAKSISLFGKDKTTKDGYKTHCKECRKKESVKRYIANKDSIDLQNKLWASNNEERAKEIKSEYYNRNIDKVKSSSVEWKINNPEAIKRSNSKYKSTHKGKVNFNTTKRRKGISERTPKWLSELDYFKIECIYDRASELQEYFGIDMHVDHIIPLHGKTVSGFHCPKNLQIVPAEYNLKKSNYLMEVA